MQPIKTFTKISICNAFFHAFILLSLAILLFICKIPGHHDNNLFLFYKFYINKNNTLRTIGMYNLKFHRMNFCQSTEESGIETERHSYA